MARINSNYLKLPGSYLFAEMKRKTNAYKAAHPEADSIRLGIGDVTRPLVPAVIDAMHRAVGEMGSAETFRGCTALEEVTIQSTVTALPDGLFADCPALHTIILTQPDPARLQVGQDLLAGAPAACRIQLPDGSYTAYCLQYSWSAYADRFCT